MNYQNLVMRVKQPAEVYGELHVGKITYSEFLEWCDAFREMIYKEGYTAGRTEGFLAGLGVKEIG